MAVTEVVIGTILAFGFQSGTLSRSLLETVIIFICVYISAFAWSWGVGRGGVVKLNLCLVLHFGLAMIRFPALDNCVCVCAWQNRWGG